MRWIIFFYPHTEIKDLSFFFILIQAFLFYFFPPPGYEDNKKGFYNKIPQLVNFILGENSLAWRCNAWLGAVLHEHVCAL